MTPSAVRDAVTNSSLLLLLLLLFSLLFTTEKGFSKSYLHITT